MKVSSDGAYFICPQCSWVKEKPSFLKKEGEATEIKKNILFIQSFTDRM